MSFLDTLMGKAPRVEEAEEELGKPDKAEAHNLPLHVERCAKRWAMSYRLSRTNNAQLGQLRIFVIIAILLEISRSSGVLDGLRLFLGGIFR